MCGGLDERSLWVVWNYGRAGVQREGRGDRGKSTTVVVVVAVVLRLGSIVMLAAAVPHMASITGWFQ